MLLLSPDNAGSHGMQIFDLTRLRNVINPPRRLIEDTRFFWFLEVHITSLINEGQWVMHM